MRWLLDIPRRTALALLWLYKRAISPFLPPACRFYPTCSVYAAEAFRTQPFGRAAWLSLRRLVKCGPWHPGGYDPVPEPEGDCCRRPDRGASVSEEDDISKPMTTMDRLPQG